MKLSPYLTFNGNCEEAFRFYATVLNGKINELNRYEGSPMETPAGMEQKIMHISLQFEENEIKACDDLKAVSMPANSQMALSFMEVLVMEKIFNDLSAGGIVSMPLQDTFWGARFGMFTDKFGIRWLFNCDLN